MALSVIGAGFGRTGTMSLKLALERLGFGPCYHMKEVFQRLEAHVPVWDSAAEGRPVDWDSLFEGFRSAVDFPAAAFYRELAEHYPQAQVVLTVREPESWYKSFSATISEPLTGDVPPSLQPWGDMVRKAIRDRVFGGDVGGKAQALASFERHNSQVRRTIPAERLLVYDVAEGWAPLAAFLGVSPPTEPFPRTNTTEEFHNTIGPMLRARAEG